MVPGTGVDRDGCMGEGGMGARCEALPSSRIEAAGGALLQRLSLFRGRRVQASFAASLPVIDMRFREYLRRDSIFLQAVS